MKKETLKNNVLKNLKDDFSRLKNPVTALEVLGASFISALGILNFALMGLPELILSPDTGLIVSKLSGAIISVISLGISSLGVYAGAKTLAGELYQKKPQ